MSPPLPSNISLFPQRDERALVVWAPSLEAIIPTCQDFEERLFKLLWRSIGAEGTYSASNSASGHSSQPKDPFQTPTTNPGFTDVLPSRSSDPEKGALVAETKTKRTWYGRKYTVNINPNAPISRPAVLYACVYNGLAAGLSLCKRSLPISWRKLSNSNLQSLSPPVLVSWSNNGCSTVVTSALLLLRLPLPSGVYHYSSPFKSSTISPCSLVPLPIIIPTQSITLPFAPIPTPPSIAPFLALLFKCPFTRRVWKLS